MPIITEEQITEKPTLTTIQSLSGTEEIVKVDSNTAIRYKVVEEKIDLGQLEIEKRGIQEQLDKVIDEKELLEWARGNYPYQNIDRAKLEARKLEIEGILTIK